MASKDDLLRRTSPIKRSGVVNGFTPNRDRPQLGQQKTPPKKRGRPPDDDEALVDEMVRLLDQRLAKSMTAASKMVAEKNPGQSVDSTARRLRRKYNDRIKWKKAGYEEQLFAIPNLPKAGIDMLCDIADIYEEHAGSLLGYGYSYDQAVEEIKKSEDRLFGIYPEIISRLKTGEDWDTIKNWIISILYKDAPEASNGPFELYKP